MLAEIIQQTAQYLKHERWRNILAETLPSPFGQSELVAALKRDHNDLRELTSTLKGDHPVSVKRTAYKKFIELLKSHSHAEERAVYDPGLKYQQLLKDILEGYAEHEVCDALMAKIATIRKPVKWEASVKVLAELVQHHVDEEERDLFPAIDKAMSPDHLLQAEAHFFELRGKSQTPGKETGVLSRLAQ